jgi:gliding-associated putative ABC transporter substrate-binding component GldG
MAYGLKKGSTTAGSIIIVVAILVVLNLISVNVFSRVDLTDSGIYSLSDASKDLMRNLNDRVLVKCFFSDDLPAPYNQNARYLKDQLAEYRAYSGGRFEFEFIDPVKADAETEAQSYRIPPVQVNAYESDRLEIKKVYMGMVFLYGDKTEVLPVLQSTTGLEYEISRAVKKVTSAAIPRIAVLTGHGEPTLQQDMQNLNQALSREYSVESLDLTDKTEIPSNIDALLIVSPKQPLSKWELFLIDQYLMRGGKLGFLLDQYQCDIQNNNCTPVVDGLDDLLNHYGIGIRDNLVLDAQCSRIGVSQQTGAFRIQNMVEFRYFPNIVDLDQENVIVKDLDGIVLTFASSLDTTVAVPDGVTRDIFAWTSEYGRSETGGFDLNPYRRASSANGCGVARYIPQLFRRPAGPGIYGQ